jgi:hypothetical protein
MNYHFDEMLLQQRWEWQTLVNAQAYNTAEFLVTDMNKHISLFEQNIDKNVYSIDLTSM